MTSNRIHRGKLIVLLITLFSVIAGGGLFLLDLALASIIQEQPDQENCRQTLQDVFDQMDNYYLRGETLPLDREERVSVDWLDSAVSPTTGDLVPCTGSDWNDCYVRPRVHMHHFPSIAFEEMPVLLLADRGNNHLQRSPIFRRRGKNVNVLMLFSDGGVRAFRLDAEEYGKWVADVDAGRAAPYPPGVQKKLAAQVGHSGPIDHSGHQH